MIQMIQIILMIFIFSNDLNDSENLNDTIDSENEEFIQFQRKKLIKKMKKEENFLGNST